MSYEVLAVEVVVRRDLAQLPDPRSDAELTLCLACGDALADCGCSPADRTEAIAVLHAELVAGRDPAPALARWRAARAPAAPPTR